MVKRYTLGVILFLTLIISIYFIRGAFNKDVEVKEVFDNSKLKYNFKFKEISEQSEDYIIKGYIPYTEYEKLNNEIQAKVNSYINDFKSNVLNKQKNSKYTFNIYFNEYEYKIYTSYVFEIEIDIGLAHPSEYIFTLNYDTKNNQIINIDKLINQNSGILSSMSKYCYDILKSNPKIKAANQDDILKEGTNKNQKNFEDFIFTKNGILVFFEKYKVAPFSAGEFNVSIPYNVLNIIF